MDAEDTISGTREALSGINPLVSGRYPPVPKNKGGRPKGFDGTRSKMPSAIAIAFKKAGLDWKTDFALAIKANKRERIGMWMKLLPYLVTTTSRARMAAAKKWKGKASKAALIALETLEGRNEHA